MQVELIRKNIKNVHLRVYPPDGRVVVSAPRLMRESAVRRFVESKLPWIRKQQGKFIALESEAPREYASGELHYFLGHQYILRIVEADRKARVELEGQYITLFIRPGTEKDKKRAVLEHWYRDRLKEILPGIITRYEIIMKVSVSGFGIKRMRTRWGTCNIATGRIWINLELAKRSLLCLEYLVVHEMSHLIERHHNKRFKSIMDKYLPDWREHKDGLNHFPLCNTESYSRNH
ncbi:MAG: M48 family metallopeptidase [Spirochaetales bacterium]|nr:M48 family metallopeptidase [Spirochaetales bacterium]